MSKVKAKLTNKKKKCKTGWSCGKSCISKKRTCHKNLTSPQGKALAQTYAQYVKQLKGGAGGGAGESTVAGADIALENTAKTKQALDKITEDAINKVGGAGESTVAGADTALENTAKTKQALDKITEDAINKAGGTEEIKNVKEILENDDDFEKEINKLGTKPKPNDLEETDPFSGSNFFDDDGDGFPFLEEPKSEEQIAEELTKLKKEIHGSNDDDDLDDTSDVGAGVLKSNNKIINTMSKNQAFYRQEHDPEGLLKETDWLTKKTVRKHLSEKLGYSEEKSQRVADSVRKYAGSWSTEIKRMEANDPNWKRPPDTRDMVGKMIKDINDHLESAPKWEKPVITGVKESMIPRLGLDKLSLGDEFQFPSMQSTTSNPDIAEDFNGGAMILVEKSKSGVSIKQLSGITYEDEIIIPKKAKYRVKSIEEQEVPKHEKSVPLIVLEEI